MKYGGISFAALLVDGYNLTAAVMDACSIGHESITQQTNPFGVGSEQHSPIQLEKGVLTVGGGCFDPTTDALHNVIGDVTGFSRVVCALIEGNTVGKHFVGFEGAYDQKYEVMDKRDGLTMANVTYLVSGVVEDGVVVQNLATFTADWDTKTGGAGVTDSPVDWTIDPVQTPIAITSCTKANPGVITTPIAHRLTTGQKILASSNTLSGPSINTTLTVTVLTTTTFSIGVDTTASSGAGTGGSFVLVNTVGGGSAYIQCTAYSGFTNLVNKIMHSPDDSTYATLVTFTTLTAIGKERKTFSGTVDRYLSNNGDVTGSGSVTVMTGVCRL